MRLLESRLDALIEKFDLTMYSLLGVEFSEYSDLFSSSFREAFEEFEKSSSSMRVKKIEFQARKQIWYCWFDFSFGGEQFNRRFYITINESKGGKLRMVLCDNKSDGVCVFSKTMWSCGYAVLRNTCLMCVKRVRMFLCGSVFKASDFFIEHVISLSDIPNNSFDVVKDDGNQLELSAGLSGLTLKVLFWRSDGKALVQTENNGRVVDKIFNGEIVDSIEAGLIIKKIDMLLGSYM